MEAFDPDQSEASLFVGTYRVVQQNFTLKNELLCMSLKALHVDFEQRVRYLLQNIKR